MKEQLVVAEVEVGVKAPIILEMLRASLERLRVKVREVVVEEVMEVVEEAVRQEEGLPDGVLLTLTLGVPLEQREGDMVALLQEEALAAPVAVTHTEAQEVAVLDTVEVAQREGEGVLEEDLLGLVLELGHWVEEADVLGQGEGEAEPELVVEEE